MSDLPEPAAHEASKADTRAAARWLIAAFAGVAAVLLSGIGLTNLGHLEGARLAAAGASFALGALAVIAAITLISRVLTPSPVTLTNLAEYESDRNAKRAKGPHDRLVVYVENDASLLQGMVRSRDPKHLRLTIAKRKYEAALDERFASAEMYWHLAREKGEKHPLSLAAREVAEAASNRTNTMHGTIRRLEKVGNAQQTVFLFKEYRGWIGFFAICAAACIGVFAFASNPPSERTADLRGAVLKDVDLSGSSLRGADLEDMEIEGADFLGTSLEDAQIKGATWEDTTCPDGTDSDNAGRTCAGHLDPG